jgi:hypothetical protein
MGGENQIAIPEAHLEMEPMQNGDQKVSMVYLVHKDEIDQHPDTQPLIVALRKMQILATEMKAELFRQYRRQP